ncbi:MAG: hypothetical protein J6B09_00065 [Clostridia bacterium]|nr:hypothetical protein [Clostridia bacterium]MBQ8717003.1 hypothetical protein [Clostridia bacterium]
MKTTTKKIYSLVSAGAILLLTLLLLVGSLMPTIKLNMASSRASELFGKCSLTSGLVLDEADVGVGALLGVAKNLGDIKVINKVAFDEMEIRDIQEDIVEIELDKAEAAAKAYAQGNFDPDLSYYDESIENKEKEIKEIQKELDDFKKSVGEAELKALEENLKDESYLDSVYTYMVVFAVYEDILWSGSGDNPQYTQYYGDTLTMALTLLSMFMLAVTIICSVVWAIVVVIALIKGVLSFLKGYKDVNAKVLDKIFPSLATSMVAMGIVTFTFSKMLLGNTVVMGAGLKFSIVIVAVLALIRVANKLLLCERCDMKKIVRTVITVVSIVLIFNVLNAVTNLELYDAHMRSSNTITPVAMETKKAELIIEKTEEALANLKEGERIDPEAIARSAEHDAKTFVTAQKLENIIPVVAVPALMAILAAVVLSCLLERLGDKQYKTKTGAVKNYRPAFVVAAIILVGAIFVSTLGVDTVKERDDLYNDEGVYFIWNEYEADNSVAKAEYETMKTLSEETEKLATELGDKVESESNETAKAELAFQHQMAERTNNLCVLATEAIEQDQKGLNSSIILLSIILIVLEVLYMISPMLIDKFVPASLQEKLAGFAADPDEEAADGEEAYAEDAAPVEETPAEEAAE